LNGATLEPNSAGSNSNLQSRKLVKFGGIANSAIRNAFAEAGFQETDKSNWDILWGSFLKKEDYRNLNEGQKCNHFPGTWELGRKDSFYKRVAGSVLLAEWNLCFLPLTMARMHSLAVTRCWTISHGLSCHTDMQEHCTNAAKARQHVQRFTEILHPSARLGGIS
jgi:hypothetical protein